MERHSLRSVNCTGLRLNYTVELLQSKITESDSMTTTATRKDNKTQFVKDVLGRNGRANAEAVNLAWTEARREGTISAALVNKLRATLGLTGNLRPSAKRKNGQPSSGKAPYTGKKRGRKPKNQATAGFALSPSHVNGRNTVRAAEPVESRGKARMQFGSLEDVEADIDRLIFKVMALGGMPEIEDTLRQARRLLYGGFSGKSR
jgi:hypothetical protein